MTAGGKPEHELRVDERDVRPDERRAADVELDLPFVIGDDRPERHLAPRARGRGDRNQRRDSPLERIVAPLVVDDRAAVARYHADRLRGVERRPAAEPDEPVAPCLGVHLRTRVHQRDVRIRSNLVEDDRVVEVLERSLGEAGRDDTRVRHEQRTRHAQLAQRLAQPADRSHSVDESRRHLDRADGFDFDGHSCSSLGGRRRSREVPLAPVLGVGDVVEREDMEAGDPALRFVEPGLDPLDRAGPG